MMAATFVVASYGKRFSHSLVEFAGRDIKKTKYYKIYHNMIYSRMFFSLCLILLSFFERPSWCFDSNCNLPRNEDSLDPSSTAVFCFSGYPVLNRNYGLIIELFCLIMTWINTDLMGILICGFKNLYLRKRWAPSHSILIIISVM